MINRTIWKRRALTALLALTLAAGLITAPVSVFADTAAQNSASSRQQTAETGSSASVSTDPLVRAEHYTINASLNTKSKQITESVTMHVVNNSSKTISRLCIVNIADGYLKYDRKHYSADVKKSAKTTVRGISSAGQPLSYKKGSDASDLYVSLGDKKLSRGDSIDVTVKVTTSIPKREDRFGYTSLSGGKTLYNLSFCFPYLSDYRNGKWNTHPYYDDGENRNNAIADYDVTFRAPSDYTVASVGKSTTSKGVTTIKAENVRDIAICASNAYKKQTFTASGITVNNYYFPGKYQKTKYMNLYNKVCRMVAQDSISLYTKNIGSYPYDELDMVECLFGFGFGGMEYPGLIMINGTQEYLAKKQSTCDFYAIQDDVSHEIGHQWFYAAVGSDEYNEAWLDEGMASFLQSVEYGLSSTPSTAYVDKLEHSPGQTAKLAKVFQSDILMRIKEQQKTGRKLYINYPVNKFPKNLDSAEIPYSRAKTFMYELYVTMGPDTFHQAMQDYYRTYCLKQATGADFLRIIRKYDNSKAVQSVINTFIR